MGEVGASKCIPGRSTGFGEDLGLPRPRGPAVVRILTLRGLLTRTAARVPDGIAEGQGTFSEVSGPDKVRPLAVAMTGSGAYKCMLNGFRTVG